jgi:preprotein translocase subunit YajC
MCQAAPAPQPSHVRSIVSNLLQLLPLVAIALLFWLILIRPAQRRQRALGQLQRAVAVGDEVMLTSGIYGTVRMLDEATVSLEVADGVILRVVRAAVGSVVTPAGENRPGEGHEGDQGEEAALVPDEPEET